jgi:E3 ubiquitin-protein ligase SIAH1
MDNSELYHLILKAIECPVCLQYMKPPITVCENGHNICLKCKSNLNTCPTCRQEFVELRSRSLESLARNVMYPCNNKNDGCPEVRPMYLISEYEAICCFRNYTSPFSKIPNLSCVQYCHLDDLKKHVLTDH